MSGNDPIFTAHVDMGVDGNIRRILVQDTSGSRSWFQLVINIEAQDITVYDSEEEGE